MFPVWSFESTQNLSKSDVLLGIKEFRADNQIFSDIVNINIRFNYSSNTFQSQISLKFLHWLKYFDWIFFNFQLDMLPLRRGATVVEEQNINAAPGPQLSTALPQYLTLNSHRTSVNLSEPQRASYGTSSCYCHSQWRVNSGASGDVSNCGKYSSHSHSDINWFYPLLKLFQIPVCPACSSWSIYRSVWKHFNFSPPLWLLTDFNFARFLHLKGKRTSESSLYLTNDMPSTQLGNNVMNILFCTEFFLHNISNILIEKILPNLSM